MINTLLIVDDEVSICTLLERYFKTKGYDVRTADTGAKAIEICQSAQIDAVVLDLRLPDMNGLDVLKNIKTNSAATGVIIITAFGDVETAVKAMQLRADNFVLKPIELSALEAIIDKTVENYRTQAEVQYLKRKVSQLEGAGQAQKLRQPPEIYHAVRLLADNPSITVLLLGETGTGKGMVASLIHQLSERRDQPFVDVNCAGLSAEFLESELFGHERGAYTDAKTFKKGLLEVANHGSIFLDEIGELSLSVQAKLLKVLEQKTFRRLGGTANLEVDVRIMAATNLHLEKAVAERKFRKDLYFRLGVMPITLPPLRDRRDDILPLAATFMEEYGKFFGKKILGLSAEVEAMLIQYQWPGNIRELKNVLERAVLLCEGPVISPEHLPENIRPKTGRAAMNLADNLSLEAMEKKHIEQVLQACQNNQSKAAQVLGIHRSTLISKIKKYEIQT